MGLVCFVFMDTAINLTQSVHRPLMADTARPDYHYVGHMFFTVHNGMGKMLGYGLGSLNLVGFVAFEWMQSNTRVLYALASIMVLVTSTLTLLNTKERRYFLPGVF